MYSMTRNVADRMENIIRSVTSWKSFFLSSTKDGACNICSKLYDFILKQTEWWRFYWIYLFTLNLFTTFMRFSIDKQSITQLIFASVLYLTSHLFTWRKSFIWNRKAIFVKPYINLIFGFAGEVNHWYIINWLQSFWSYNILRISCIEMRFSTYSISVCFLRKLFDTWINLLKG